MSDDWRVELDVEDHDAFHRALDRMRERGVARDARARLADDVTISVSGDHIFAYAQSREQAQEAAAVLAELAREHHLEASTQVARWQADDDTWVPDDGASG